jgi:hypothetical protein
MLALALVVLAIAFPNLLAAQVLGLGSQLVIKPGQTNIDARLQPPSPPAIDGRRLDDEPSETQIMFRAVWGDQAGQKWAEQHSEEIRFVMRLEGECPIRPLLGFGAAWFHDLDVRERLWCAVEPERLLDVFERDEPDQMPPARMYWTSTLCFWVRRDGTAVLVGKPSAPSCAGHADRASVGAVQVFQRGWMLYIPGPTGGIFALSTSSNEILRR